MRECLRCGTPMNEDITIATNGPITLIKGYKGIFPLSYGTPKAAVCPKCGEVSFYLTKKRKKKELPEV